jgi:carbonic anhydrase/acetyltransferase-like protein (isoleucine patch superfamily)
MINESVVVFTGAVIDGKVNIDNKSSVWFNAVLRGDIEPLNIGKCSNVQDNCVLHSSKGYPLISEIMCRWGMPLFFTVAISKITV